MEDWEMENQKTIDDNYWLSKDGK